MVSFQIVNAYCSNNKLYLIIYNNGNIPININRSITIISDNQQNAYNTTITCNNTTIIQPRQQITCNLNNIICYYDPSSNSKYKVSLIVDGKIAEKYLDTGYEAHLYKYLRNVIIDNTQNLNNLTDYQILITLDTQSLISQGKMRSDCGDVRFTDSDGKLLNYWIEPNTCNTNNTKIWVKVPFIPGSSTKTIYLWYGNPNANSLSNIENTFTEMGTFYHTRYSYSTPNSLAEAIIAYNSAQDIPGYCWAYIINYSNIANHIICPSGSLTNISYWIEAYFYVDEPGVWEFRFGVDYGRGGGLYIDGIPLNEIWYKDLWWDLWWGYDWNSNGVLKGSIYLSVGWHKLFSIGFEGCCDGGTALQFKKPSGDWKYWSITEIKIKSRKYTSPEPSVILENEVKIQ